MLHVLYLNPQCNFKIKERRVMGWAVEATDRYWIILFLLVLPVTITNSAIRLGKLKIQAEK